MVRSGRVTGQCIVWNLCCCKLGICGLELLAETLQLSNWLGWVTGSKTSGSDQKFTPGSICGTNTITLQHYDNNSTNTIPSPWTNATGTDRVLCEVYRLPGLCVRLSMHYAVRIIMHNNNIIMHTHNAQCCSDVTVGIGGLFVAVPSCP